MSARREKSIPAAIQGPRILLLLCVLALTLMGLVMVFSASSISAIDSGMSANHYFVSQVIYVVVGIAIAWALWKVVPYRFWTSQAVWGIWLAAMALIVLTALFGDEYYGAKRWLSIGGFSLQPSEFVKIAMLLLAIRFMSQYQEGDASLGQSLVKAILFILIPLMVMYKAQSDLGTTLICLVGIYAVMWVGGVPMKYMGLLALLAVGFFIFAVVGSGYRSGRMVFLDPWNDGEGGYGSGYNIIRSYYAIAQGGLFGVGLGNSHEKFQYLFGSESDFIFAILSEELGMFGALVVIALFVGVLVAGIRLALTSDDPQGTMIAGGCTIMLVFQAFLNIGVVIGVLPTTGKPLPFISAGGSSMLASMIMIGLVLAVSKGSESNVYEQRRDDLRIVQQERSSDAGSFVRRRNSRTY